MTWQFAIISATSLITAIVTATIWLRHPVLHPFYKRASAIASIILVGSLIVGVLSYRENQRLMQWQQARIAKAEAATGNQMTIAFRENRAQYTIALNDALAECTNIYHQLVTVTTTVHGGHAMTIDRELYANPTEAMVAQIRVLKFSVQRATKAYKQVEENFAGMERNGRTEHTDAIGRARIQEQELGKLLEALHNPTGNYAVYLTHMKDWLQTVAE